MSECNYFCQRIGIYCKGETYLKRSKVVSFFSFFYDELRFIEPDAAFPLQNCMFFFVYKNNCYF